MNSTQKAIVELSKRNEDLDIDDLAEIFKTSAEDIREAFVQGAVSRFKRVDLCPENTSPLYVHDARGDFHNGVAAIRISGGKCSVTGKVSKYAVAVHTAEEFRFRDVMQDINTLRDAKEYAARRYII